jgi:hypothetical protein
MNQPKNSASSDCTINEKSSPSVITYSSDISRRWAKISEDMKEIQITGVKGTGISAVYANTIIKRSIPPNTPLPIVGFSAINKEPSDYFSITCAQ